MTTTKIYVMDAITTSLCVVCHEEFKTEQGARECCGEEGTNTTSPCPCCKEEFKTIQEALDCCQKADMLHIKEEEDPSSTICGITADDDMDTVEDMSKLSRDTNFDPNGYCHFCLREDQNN